MLDMFLRFGFFCRIKLLTAEGRRDFRGSGKVIPGWATEDPGYGAGRDR